MTFQKSADFTARQILALNACSGDLSLVFWRPGDWPFLVLPVMENEIDLPDGWSILEWDEAVAWAKEHINA